MGRRVRVRQVPMMVHPPQGVDDQLTLDGIAPAHRSVPLFSWPGGKRRLVKSILPHLRGYAEVVSPFMGGAAVELALAAEGTRVHASDANRDLVVLWDILLNNPARIADRMAELQGCAPETMLAEIVMDGKEQEQRAIALYFRLRTTLYHMPEGKVLHTSTGNGWKPKHAEFWRTYVAPLREREVRKFRAPNMTVSCCDYADALAAHPGMPAYLDPPYVQDKSDADYAKLYANHGIDHVQLAEQLKARSAPWVLSINDCEWARDTFAGNRMVEVQVKWLVGARIGSVQPHRKELLILG